jgi:hypothetical protein
MKDYRPSMTLFGSRLFTVTSHNLGMILNSEGVSAPNDESAEISLESDIEGSIKSSESQTSVNRFPSPNSVCLES